MESFKRAQHCYRTHLALLIVAVSMYVYAMMPASGGVDSALPRELIKPKLLARCDVEPNVLASRMTHLRYNCALECERSKSRNHQTSPNSFEQRIWPVPKPAARAYHPCDANPPLGKDSHQLRECRAPSLGRTGAQRREAKVYSLLSLSHFPSLSPRAHLPLPRPRAHLQCS